MPSPADPHLTIDQAADALGTNPDHITAGHLDHASHDDQLRIPESALIAHAVTVGDSLEDAESLAPPELSAAARVTDTHAFSGQEVAA